jgi:hypothetical protein
MSNAIFKVVTAVPVCAQGGKTAYIAREESAR